MATIKLEQAQPKQIEFMKLKNRYVGYGGARGGGKSWAVRAKCVLMCSKHDGLRCVIIRKTYKDLNNNHIEPLKAVLRECIQEKKVKYNAETHTFTFWNGSTIECAYCATESDLEHFQGIEYDVIVLDEATQHTYTVFSNLTACLRGRENLPKRIYLTCNPGGVGHEWVKRLFVDRAFLPDEDPEDYAFVRALATDNAYNGKDYMKMLNQLQEPLRSAWRDGLWDVFVGQYFPEWDLDALSVPCFEIPDHWCISMSIDYGLDCFAPIWYATDEGGTDYIIREYSAKNTIIRDAARLIHEIETDMGLDDRKIRRYAPPDLWNRKSDSGLSTIDIFNQYDLRFVKADNDRITGWLAVKERISKGSLKIFEGRANQLSYCMRLLQHDDVRINDVAKDPHEITHLPDSLRYFLIMRGRKVKTTPVRYSNNIIDRRGIVRAPKRPMKVNVSGMKGGW